MTGIEIKNELDKRGITQASLARKLGMSPSVLNSRLSRKMMKIEFIRQIEEAIGFSLETTISDNKSNILIPRDFYDNALKEIVELRKERDKLISTISELEKDNAVLRVQLRQYTNIEKEKTAVV